MILFIIATLLLTSITRYVAAYATPVLLKSNSIQSFTANKRILSAYSQKNYKNDAYQVPFILSKKLRKRASNAAATIQAQIPLGPDLSVAAQRLNVKIADPHLTTHVKTLHKQGHFGQGIKIAVLDSGIDYTHPALGGCFGDGCKVAYGYDFVGNDFDGIREPVPDNDPKDECSGHGTAVAGIIAAKTTTLVGVVPEAILGAYRIVGCNGETWSSLIKSALEMALKDDMSIINVSLSSVAYKNSDIVIDMVEKMTEQGIIVVAAAGNDRAGLMWQARSPAVSPSVISVAAAHVPTKMMRSFRLLGRHSVDIPYVTPCSALAIPTEKHFIAMVTVKAKWFSCLIEGSFRNKLMFVTSGQCKIEHLLDAAKKGGALGIITSISAPDSTQCSVPLYIISKEYSKLVMRKLTHEPLSHLKFATKSGQFELLDDICIDNSSNWGPTPWLTSNSDISAPGIKIMTTSISTTSRYEYKDGTSMATGYVAGAVALYLEVHKQTKADVAALKMAFQSTATPVVASDSALLGSIAHQGAGFINVERAIYDKSRVMPPVIELKDTESRGKQHRNVVERQIHIINGSKQAKTYTISHQPSASIRGYNWANMPNFPPEHSDGFADVYIPIKKISIPPESTRTITVSIGQPYSLLYKENWVYSGYIVADPGSFDPNNISREAVRVPYFGLKGDIKQVIPLICRYTSRF